MARRQEFDSVLPGTVSEVFAALGKTVSFRRWGVFADGLVSSLPHPGLHYRHRSGSVIRDGRVVEINRPVGLTLKEMLHDPPCRVVLTLRWRIEPVAAGSSLRLCACYRLNHAALLRGRHWDRRLRLHFQKQLRFVAANLDLMQDEIQANRDLTHL